jgi:long-chain acyl-CoA synthetase
MSSEETRLIPSAISSEQALTLPGLFRARVERSPGGIAYQQFEDGAWRGYSWRDIASLVGRWQRALEREGLERGDRVAVSLRNGVEWVCLDQAALGLGLVVVPLYTTDNADNLVHILADSGARLVLLESDAGWPELAARRQALTDLRRVLCLRREEAAGDELIRYLTDWLPTGDFPLAVPEVRPDDLATLVYTSGTTGRSKGVMLSHRNILWNVEAVLRRIPAFPSDVFLSFLPLAHAFERTVGYYLPMMAGCQVTYARSIALLPQDLRAVRPSVLLSVPRIYDKIYLAVQAKLAGRLLRRKLFEATVAIGWRRFEADSGRRPPPGLADRLLGPVLRRVVARQILDRLGGRIRVAVSGGAPLSEPVARFFIGLGLPLTEGYGLTEAAPVISGTQPREMIPGAVGRALPGVEVRLGPEGELLARAPSVMQGYWHQPEATRQAIDATGWLHTGDLAEIQDGCIRLRGRLKDILVTSTGEKIPPGDMEMALTLDPLIEQALVVGEGRPYLAALLVLNPDAWGLYAKDLGVDPHDPASLRARATLEAVLGKVHARLQGFPGYARVRALYLTLEPWTIEDGLVTPTLKVRREALEARLAETIDALYRRGSRAV